MYFTIVYNLDNQEEAKELMKHSRMAAAAWGHAIQEVGTEETLRDKFAAQAIPELLSRTSDETTIAARAYAVADAMLKIKESYGCL
jgi:hypothetical protein